MALRRTLALRITLTLCMGLALASSAFAAESDKTSLNFVNADIPEVIRAISHISKKNFLVDPRVKGTINIVSATPVSSEQAYNIMLSALRLQGFAAVESNGVTKVMPEADAKLYIGELNTGHGSKDQLVTRIFPLQYESAAQLVNIVRPLIAPNNIVVAYPNTNTLVVTDYASNLKRIEEIVHAIDRPDQDTPVDIPVLHVSAMDLAQTINRLMQDGAQGADGSNRFILLADARSNSLLLRSSNPDRIARVRELVKMLDVKTSAPGNIHVVYLKNADATKVAQTLRAVMSGEVSAPAPVGMPGAPAVAAPASGGMVQADQASNALIIIAPDAVYNNLRAVVDMLDVRRAQVFVEALIAEVSADKVAKFGIQWQALSGAAGTANTAKVFGGTNLVPRGAGNIIDASANIGNVSEGLNVGVVKGQLTIPGIGTVLNLGALANALEQDANANILSTPNLLTLDNEEAKIVIGQNVPFITGQYAQTGATATASPFQTIDRKDVGLTLRIKPQISEGGTVKLQIYQEVSSVDAASLSSPAGIITNKRSLESSVLVDDGQIIALGGLIQDQVSVGETRVPLLGSIPLLGALFRYETRQHTKTNLMIFIRPHVLRDKTAGNSLTQDRYDYLREAQANSQPSWSAILPNMIAPQLPVIDLSKQASAPIATNASMPAPGADDAGNKPGSGAANNPAASAVPATMPSSGNAPASAVPATTPSPQKVSAAENKGGADANR